MPAVQAQDFVDAFGSRVWVTGLKGTQTGSTVGTSIESDEPRHGGKASSHSVWLTWEAPSNGLMKIEVDGQDFDVLLGVYRLKAGEPPVLKSLERVASNDDGRDVRSAAVGFGTRAGERYEIAIDGFAGSTGGFKLKWEMQELTEILPVIVTGPADQAFPPGSRVVLTYQLDDLDDVNLHWFLNDVELQDQEGPTLIIPSLTEAQVGQYRLRIDTDSVRYFSEPVEVQLSTEGSTGTLARNKPEDAMQSALIGAGGQRPGPLRQARPAGDGITRGYNGSQVFDTVYSGRDAAEPIHCGKGSGSSYWFGYYPPASGEMDVDTAGSSFDTVIAVYTYEMPYLGYASLREVTCDDNSGPDGRSSRVRFRADVAQRYIVVVDGVNGARGRAHLNYRLETNAIPVLMAPRIISVSAGQVVREGSSVALSVVAEGTLPLSYRWLPTSAAASGITNHLLDLGSARAAIAGSYQVEVSNQVGAVLSTPIPVSVWSPPAAMRTLGGGWLLRYLTAGPALAELQVTPTLDGAWAPWPTAVPDANGVVEVRLDPDLAPQQFWRLKLPNVP